MNGVMTMSVNSGFPAVTVAVLLMTLPTSQVQMDGSQAAPLPADMYVQISGGDVKKPLLLAGNTACNPRVTVCEE